MYMIKIIKIYALRIKNISESAPRSYEATKAVARKAQKKGFLSNRFSHCYSVAQSTSPTLVLIAILYLRQLLPANLRILFLFRFNSSA